MQQGFRLVETITHPVADVWATVTDWARAPEWMRGVRQMRRDGAGPPARGRRVHFEARGSTRTCEIVEWNPERRLTLRSRQGGVTAIYDNQLQPHVRRTQVTLRIVCHTRGVWRVIGPIIRVLVHVTDGKQLKHLKQLLDRS